MFFIAPQNLSGSCVLRKRLCNLAVIFWAATRLPPSPLQAMTEIRVLSKQQATKSDTVLRLQALLKCRPTACPAGLEIMLRITTSW